MNAPKFKKIKSVTLPLFKWANGVTRYFLFDGAMFTGKEVKAVGGKQMEPAKLAFVTDLETGAQGQIILGQVLQNIMNEEYPENAYVKKAFAITQNKVDGKGYNVYTVEEIEVESEAEYDESKFVEKPKTEESELGGHPHDPDAQDIAEMEAAEEEKRQIEFGEKSGKHGGKKK